MKGLIIIFMIIGSSIGGYLPVLWGGSFLSFSSVILSGIGGVAGIWAGYKIAKRIGMG